MGKNKELQEFYYNILHLRQNEKTKIENIIIQNKEKFCNLTDDFEGLCKIISNHIALDLDQIGVDYKLINLQKAFGFFDHECVIVRYKYPNCKFGYLLVDISFKQFLPKKGKKVNPHLQQYPPIILSETEIGKTVTHNLLENGFCDIDNEILTQYINSFRGKNEKITVSLEDYFVQKYK